MRRAGHVVAALSLCLVLVAGTTPAFAQGDTTAVAINTKDGTSIFRFAFQIRRVMNDVVDQGNAAVAFASCEECQTVALSIQVLLLMGDPNVVSPENLALAMNYECTSCETLASAYQYVFTTGGPVYFTAEGNQTLADLRTRLRDLLRSDLPIEELQAQIDLLNEELAVVLAEELVAAGPTDPATATDAGAEPTAEPATTPDDESTSTAPESTPTPETTEGSTTPEPDPSDT